MLGLFYTKMYKVDFLIAPIYHCHCNYRVLLCHKFCFVSSMAYLPGILTLLDMLK